MPRDKMISTNGKRLEYARNYYGFGLDEVAKKTKIKFEQLENFEKGVDFPTYTQLEKLADIYNRSLIFFFIVDDPGDLTDNKMSANFRKINKNTQTSITPKQKMLIEKADCYVLNLKEIYREDNSVSFKELLSKGHVELPSLSQWLRENLHISIENQIKDYKNSSQLLEAFREKFYNIGIYVFKDSFQDNSVSGLSIPDDKFPVILLNNKMVFSRQLFTLFHEIYHIFNNQVNISFNRDSYRDSEKECDKFASSFLIPEDHLSKYIQKLGITQFEDVTVIKNLAENYHVSRDALAYKLLSLELISQEFYAAFHKGSSDYVRNMNADTSGGDYYYTKISYLGKSYLNTVLNKYYSGKISATDVGVYAQIKTSNLSNLVSKFYRGTM